MTGGMTFDLVWGRVRPRCRNEECKEPLAGVDGLSIDADGMTNCAKCGMALHILPVPDFVKEFSPKMVTMFCVDSPAIREVEEENEILLECFNCKKEIKATTGKNRENACFLRHYYCRW